MILWSDIAIIVYIIIIFEVNHNTACFCVGNDVWLSVDFDSLTLKVIGRSLGSTFAQGFSRFLLESRGEVCITLIGDNSKNIYIMDVVSKQFLILTDAVAVNGDTQATANLLTFGSG
ncbi:hypothetical protein IMSAGC016_01283 [Muribaculaceae bacterium]|nr:hypothetical protein IMSAGC016_01283 [Muribaculaceae bacterium]